MTETNRKSVFLTFIPRKPESYGRTPDEAEKFFGLLFRLGGPRFKRIVLVSKVEMIGESVIFHHSFHHS
jgi:hypothetical protein